MNAIFKIKIDLIDFHHDNVIMDHDDIKDDVSSGVIERSSTVYFYLRRPFTGICLEKNGISYVVNGEFHREDGPAIEYDNGRKEWWLNNKRYIGMDEWAETLGIIDTDAFTLVKLEWG